MDSPKRRHLVSALPLPGGRDPAARRGHERRFSGSGESPRPAEGRPGVCRAASAGAPAQASASRSAASRKKAKAGAAAEAPVAQLRTRCPDIYTHQHFAGIPGVRGTSFVPRTFLPDSMGMGLWVGGG